MKSTFDVISMKTGSKGNMTILSFNGKKIAIDAGIKENVAGIPIFITHHHADHNKYMDYYRRERGCDIYAPFKEGINNQINILYEQKFYLFQDELVKVKAVSVNHDINCYAFIIYYGNEIIVYATDLNSIPDELETVNPTVLFLEFNHTPKIIEDKLYSGDIPTIYGLRVLETHLSTDKAIKYIKSKLNTLKEVYLIHISEHNIDDSDIKMIDSILYPLRILFKVYV